MAENRNKKYLFEVEISYLTDRDSQVEVPQKYVENFFCTGRQLDDFQGVIERSHLKSGGKVSEFRITKQS